MLERVYLVYFVIYFLFWSYKRDIDRTGYPRKEGYYAHELNIVDDPISENFDGPYTLNFIGGGIALTELNVVSLSELLSKYVKAGVVDKVCRRYFRLQLYL